MSFVGDVGINFLSGLLAGGVSSTATVLWLRAREWLPARRLWRLRDPRNLTVIVSTSHVQRHLGGTTRPGTGVGQLRGIALLTPSLIRGYGSLLRPDMVMLSSEVTEEQVEGDIVLLGGPRTNEIAGRVCAAKDLPVYMCDNYRGDGTGTLDSRIHWVHSDGSVEVMDTADEGEFVYGMVLRHTNVLVETSPGRMWMIAGSSTLGTQAAAEWLVQNERMLRKAPETVAVVVKAKKIPGSPTRIRAPEVHLQRTDA